MFPSGICFGLLESRPKSAPLCIFLALGLKRKPPWAPAHLSLQYPVGQAVGQIAAGCTSRGDVFYSLFAQSFSGW